MTWANAIELTAELGGRWYGDYGMAFCPAHENFRTPALMISDGPNNRIRAHCFGGCNPKQVYQEICKSADRSLKFEIKRRGRLAASSKSDDEKERDRQRKARARRIWAACEPIDGSVVERYLASRCIFEEIPDTIGFQPKCFHSPSRRNFPAMVAVVQRENEIVGIHRTYLDEFGRKAPVEPVKMMLGPVAGGGVQLAPGRAGPVVICEGIETGLSLRRAVSWLTPEFSIVAALSTSGVQSYVLPPKPRELMIAPDGDRAGILAAEQLAQRAFADGWDVKIIPAPPGKDWNDLLQGGYFQWVR